MDPVLMVTLTRKTYAKVWSLRTQTAPLTPHLLYHPTLTKSCQINLTTVYFIVTIEHKYYIYNCIGIIYDCKDCMTHISTAHCGNNNKRNED